MEIINFQDFVASLPKAQDFSGKNGDLSKRQTKKTDNFASKLNNVLERSATHKDESSAISSQSADLGKQKVCKNKNDLPKESRSKQDVAVEDKNNFNESGSQPFTGVGQEETLDKFLGSKTVNEQMPPGITPHLNGVPDLAGKNSFLLANSFTEEMKTEIPLMQNNLNALFPPDVKNLNAIFGETDILADAQAVLEQNPGLVEKAELETNPNALTANLISGETAKQFQVQRQPEQNPALDIFKSDGQPVVAEILSLKVKESSPQGFANQQNAAGQQAPFEQVFSANQNFANQQNAAGEQESFEQVLNPKSDLSQSTEQISSNNNNTFAIFADNPAHTLGSKQDIDGNIQRTTENFAAPRDEFNVKAQIAEQVALINRTAQESEMIIRLKPEHLGEMVLKITVNNGVVNASFHSNNLEVRGILENSIHQLKQDLANVGFRVDNVSISAGLSQFATYQERELQWHQQGQKSSAKNGETGYADAVDGIATSQQIINFSKDAGVDYRI